MYWWEMLKKKYIVFKEDAGLRRKKMFLHPELYLSSYTTGKPMDWVNIYLAWLICIEQSMVL